MIDGTKLSYNFRKWLAVTTFVVVLSSVIGTSISLAQSSSISNASLAISPLTFVLNANPGDRIENTLKVTNAQSKGTIGVEMEVKAFTGTETGEAVVLEEDNPAYALGKWVTVTPSTFVLAPKETKIVTYVINVPNNAEPGGRYASILAKSGTENFSGTGAATLQRVGSLVLLSVNGTISYSSTVKDFKTVKSGGEIEKPSDQFNFEGAPVTFFTRLSNTGTSHIKPTGFVVISNLFGKKIGGIPVPERYVLPGNDRVLETVWQDAKLGYYTATLLLNYGDKNEQLTATTTFMVFPWKTGVPIILGALIVLWFLIARRKRLIKAIGVIFAKH